MKNFQKERWRGEYLQALSVESKPKHDDLAIKAGDVVLLKPKTLEKNQWRLARVDSVQRNPDGVVATATVRLPSGQFVKRSLKQIALLEADVTAAEADVLDPPKETGRAGTHGRMLESPRGGRPTPRVYRSPDQGRPCQPLDVGKESKAPGDAVAVAADPVPENDGNDAPVAGASRPDNLRKKRRRIGYYKDLHEGKEAKRNKK